MDQQNLLTKCADDFLFKVTEKTGEAWTASAVQWRSQYKACAKRHNSLVDAINEQ